MPSLNTWLQGGTDYLTNCWTTVNDNDVIFSGQLGSFTVKRWLGNRDYLESQAVSVSAPAHRTPLGICVDQENILL